MSSGKTNKGEAMESKPRTSGKTALRKLVKAAAWVAGIWLVLLLMLQVILSPSVLKKITGNLTEELIDGELSFSTVKVNMFRHFPNVGISIEDGSLTYPADRFDEIEKAGAQGRLMYHGNGSDADTLVSFRRFSASVNIAALISGKISIPHIILEKPRIFAHTYDDNSSNWDIFKLEAGTDTSGTSIPPLAIGRIRLTDHPHVVYTDSRDTLFAMLDVKKIAFDGKLDTRRSSRNRIGLSLDSLLLAGRLAADTIGFGMDRLHIHEHHDHMDIRAEAKALMATRAFGRIHIPLSISGTAAFPDDTVPAIALHGFKADIAAMPIGFDFDIRKDGGLMLVDGRFEMSGCRIEDMIDGFVRNFIPEANDLKTDASVTLKGTCSGRLGNGEIPSVNAVITIPEAHAGHARLAHDIRLGLSLEAGTDKDGKVDVTLNDAVLKTYGLDMSVRGSVSDILGEDPAIGIDGRLAASADSLLTFLPEDSGIAASGRLSAELKGSIRKSQMDIYNFGDADLSGKIFSDRFVLKSAEDTVDVELDGLDIHIGPEVKTSVKEPGKTFRLLGIKGSIAKAGVSLKGEMSANAEGMSFSAKNSADAFSDTDTTRIHPLGGYLSASKMSLEDGTGMSLTLNDTRNSFQMIPKKDNHMVPVLSLSSTNKRIYLRDVSNRVILTDASLKGSAAMNSIERRQKRRAMIDSLSAANPEISRDSLMRSLRSQRRGLDMPSWMNDDDLKSGDINFSLEGAMAKYFREWDVDGDIDIRTGIIMTPYLPLRNILKGVDISLNNNEVKVDSFKIVTGRSELAARGSLKGLKRALLGRGTYLLDMDVTSDRMDADELLAALNAGSSFDPEDGKDKMAEASDSEFLKMVVADSLENKGLESLIIVPANLMADIRLNAKDVNFSDMDISKFHADIIMKERCMQIINASASTNMGEGRFEGFYSTRSKNDVRTGFDLNLTDVTSEKVIAMMPAIDTIMPLLKSFKGLVNCEMAATASLDTCMNILTPSINGVIRIGGENLTMSDNEVFSSLARKLKFKNSSEGKINKMTVEGVIKDNTLEVFPFIVDLDRYTLALSGLHNLDMSFKYHVSIIRSPLVFKVGVDLYGPDFDNLKFKIGRPKYKNTDIPVFTTVIDETRVNLAKSIRNIFIKGVDLAVRENEEQDAIEDLKDKIGYVNAAEQKMEELSEDEKRQLEETQETSETNIQDIPETTEYEQSGIH